MLTGTDHFCAKTVSTERRLKVTVLAGGPSAERDVSLESGRAIAAALRNRGHAVHLADIDPDHLGALDVPADVIFPALHGTFGEDGQLQQILEQRGLPFVGSGSAASAIAIDKVATKRLVEKIGIATPAYRVLTAESMMRILPELRAPLVAKPVDQGSSVATHIIHDDRETADAVREVIAEYGQVMVEQFIRGEELTVGILADQPLPPICIRPRRPFYDYAAKYLDDATEYHFDTGHPPQLLERIAAESLAAFLRLGCRHLARVDWMIDASGRAWFLEVNTLPGFTSHSLVPKAAERLGTSFDELCERLVCMAASER